MSWKGGEKWWKGQLGGRRDGGEEKNGLNSSHMVGKWCTFTCHKLSFQIQAFFLSKSIPVCRHNILDNITIFLKVFCNHFCLKKLQRDYGRVYRYIVI